MFRGAEVAVFHDVRQELRRVNQEHNRIDFPQRLPALGESPTILEDQKYGELIMAENFRSTPSILFFLNYLFSRIFLATWEPGRPFHVPHQELRPGRSQQNKEETIQQTSGPTFPAPVECLFVVVPDEENSAQASLTEPEFVSLRIQELSHVFRYADIAILLRTRTRLKDFEEALRQYDIPFVVAGGIGREGVEKLTLNTNSLDHPRALPNYQRLGFVPVRREERTRTLTRPRA